MKSIRQRLERVSSALTRSTSSKCPLCGWYEGVEFRAEISFATEMADLANPTPVDRSKDLCVLCGRPLVIRIEFDDCG